MAPLREYMCRDCVDTFEVLEQHPEDAPQGCIRCESSNIERLPSAAGGYTIRGANTSSSTPKHAGSFRKSKT